MEDEDDDDDESVDEDSEPERKPRRQAARRKERAKAPAQSQRATRGVKANYKCALLWNQCTTQAGTRATCL